MKTLTKCDVCNYGYFLEIGHLCGHKEKLEKKRRTLKELNKVHLQKEEKRCPVCRKNFKPLGHQVYCSGDCEYWVYRTGDKKQAKIA